MVAAPTIIYSMAGPIVSAINDAATIAVNQTATNHVYKLEAELGVTVNWIV